MASQRCWSVHCVILTVLAWTALGGNMPSAGPIKVLPLPAELAGYKRWFTKYVPIFGMPILAAKQVPDWKVEHAGNIMAQYLDFDADGTVNNGKVHAEMVKHKSTLVMFYGDPPGAVFDKLEKDKRTGQDLDNADIPSWVPHNGTTHSWRALRTGPCTSTASPHQHPHLGALRSSARCGGPNADDFDASLEEILHLITDTGYTAAYPEVFSTKSRNPSQIMQTMTAMIGDCGYAFNHTRKYPNCQGKFHYSDATCDLECLATEYTYWTLVTLLGGEDGSHGDALKSRCKDIMDEWEMCTPALLKQFDPKVVAIYDVAGKNQYQVPTVLPDGHYKPKEWPNMELHPNYHHPTHARISRGGDGWILPLDADPTVVV